MDALRANRFLQQKLRFMDLTTALAEITARENVLLTPFLDPDLPHFTAASEENRDHVLWILEKMVSIGRSVQSSNQSVRDSEKLIGAFLKAMNYTTAPDFTYKIRGNCGIDIYNDKFQLIFANFLFFELVSYSIEDLYFRPWYELFSHEPADIQFKLLDICKEILRGPDKKWVNVSNLGVHRVSEIDSPRQANVLVLPTFFSPIMHYERIVGYLCINELSNLPATADGT